MEVALTQVLDTSADALDPDQLTSNFEAASNAMMVGGVGIMPQGAEAESGEDDEDVNFWGAFAVSGSPAQKRAKVALLHK